MVHYKIVPMNTPGRSAPPETPKQASHREKAAQDMTKFLTRFFADKPVDISGNDVYSNSDLINFTMLLLIAMPGNEREGALMAILDAMEKFCDDKDIDEPSRTERDFVAKLAVAILKEFDQIPHLIDSIKERGAGIVDALRADTGKDFTAAATEGEDGVDDAATDLGRV